MSKTNELAKKMLFYFETAGTPGSEYKEDIPSFVRFARSEGIFTDDLLLYKEKNAFFSRIYTECEKIRTDRIIDGALHKRLDASVSRMLIAAYTGLSDKAAPEDTQFQLKITLSEPETPPGKAIPGPEEDYAENPDKGL